MVLLGALVLGCAYSTSTCSALPRIVFLVLFRRLRVVLLYTEDGRNTPIATHPNPPCRQWNTITLSRKFLNVARAPRMSGELKTPMRRAQMVRCASHSSIQPTRISIPSDRTQHIYPSVYATTHIHPVIRTGTPIYPFNRTYPSIRPSIHPAIYPPNHLPTQPHLSCVLRE